eukprot:CAMPEP_0115848946 /NCGR_PEP_ID=MMETSP0287-20121206/11193_1 /TAXON_ID=412157 /ORGANISM="Chrysochromulina rotalis, Strain UIO044" /LENGTH=183 /DNA_ID=CAMNT_0003302893 /DNA_START=53 /DNA_END=604 /DNA_ORIENTATION=+
MGSAFAKCLAPDPPPVVFTVCPSDGRAHEFATADAKQLTPQSACSKCGQTKQQIDLRCQACRDGQHEWVQDYEPISQAQPQAAGPPGVTQGVAVMPVFKCRHCGLRQQERDGVAYYDDYYMYGGGYMLGADMMMFGIMGASMTAFADPCYGDYYGGTDMAGYGDAGFAADDGGGDFGDDFGFD